MKNVSQLAPGARQQRIHATFADRKLTGALHGKAHHASRDNLILEDVLRFAIQFLGQFVDKFDVVAWRFG